MNLNFKQRIIVTVGAAIIVGMGIYPPWIYTFKSREDMPGSYGFITSPPSAYDRGEIYFSEPRSYEPGSAPISLMPGGSGTKLDLARLIVQWIMIAALTGVGVFVAAKRNGK